MWWTQNVYGNCDPISFKAQRATFPKNDKIAGTVTMGKMLF